MKTLAAQIAALLVTVALPLSAQSAADMVQVGMLPGWQTPQGTRIAALDLQLAPGWKTYWRAPGEAGIPPSFDWTGSENLAGVRFHWPSPEVFELNGMQSIGYHDRLVLPFEVTAKDPLQPVTIRLRMDLGVCDQICLPASVTLQGRLTGAGAPDTAIHAALAARPLTAGQAGLTGIGCEVEPIDDGLRLTASITLPKVGHGTEAVVFESADPTIWISAAEALRQGGNVVASSDLVATSGAPFALDREGMVVTIIAGKRSVELRGCPAPG